MEMSDINPQSDDEQPKNLLVFEKSKNPNVFPYIRAKNITNLKKLHDLREKTIINKLNTPESDIYKHNLFNKLLDKYKKRLDNIYLTL